MTARGLTAVQDPAERAALRTVTDVIAADNLRALAEPADCGRQPCRTRVCRLRRCHADRRSRAAFPIRQTGRSLRDLSARHLPHRAHHRNGDSRLHETGSAACGRSPGEKGAPAHRAHAGRSAKCRATVARTAPDLPERPSCPRVRDRCAAIIAGHDYWKLGKPHPPAEDREALVCFEADALWPLHPLGVLADLERSGKDVNDPQEWRTTDRPESADAS